MSKMHELLAVESSVTANYNRDLDETLKVFERADLFRRETTVKEFFDSEMSHLNVTDTKEITTTVRDRLAWNSKSIAALFDLVLQKDKTNQSANADVEVDGQVVAKNVPATTLLMLETRLQDLRKMFNTIPVLPPGVQWIKDEQSNLWRSESAPTFSTKKTSKAVVMYEATKEHPAQVKEVFEDVPVAKITKTTYAGLLTSSEKATLLGRLDSLLKAVKTARMRANMAEANKDKIGDALVSYLYNGLPEQPA